MAGLFDDKGFKAPPMMGKRARNKLNKHGFYRMPPNLKGLPAQAEGGLGGAISKGRKQRKFADGGLNEITSADRGKMSTPPEGLGFTPWEDAPANQIEEVAPEDEIATDDTEVTSGLAAGSGNYSPDVLRERMALGRQKIADAYRNYMTQAQQTMQGMQAPKDTSWMSFAANMLKPTHGGGFAANLGNALTGFQGAQSDYQKQLQDFNNTRARLGLDVAGIPLQQEAKLAEMEARQFSEDQRREDLKAYREALIKSKEGPEGGKTLPPATIDKLTKKAETLEQIKGLNSTFKPEFGGFVSDVAGDTTKWLASRGEGTDDISSWWRGYNDYAQVVRHELYGSAFTAAEKKSWDATNITPGMHPDKIKENLDRRQNIINSALDRSVNALQKAGYNAEVLREPLGLIEEQFTAKNQKTDTDSQKKPLTQFQDLPDASQFKDRTLRDPATGKRMRSNGSQWQEIK